LFVDFAGDTLAYVDRETGEMVNVQVFVACLPCTDYFYAICVPSQRSEDFIYAIEQCLLSFGGVPRILVPDNLKAAVIKSDRYDPRLITHWKIWVTITALLLFLQDPESPKTSRW
jgi:transposase